MKKHIITLLILILLNIKVSYASDKFEVIQKEYIKDINSELIVYNHKKSKARVIYLKNKDKNKVFTIGFKTPVEDDTGVNHIIEHAVFTGSRKYKSKDVFFDMKKQSLSTYMNASTAIDMTLYPFSTRNDKDFYNLLDVYLDAVFFPNLQVREYGFWQEGWHYFIDENNNININGVVYNEMKGALNNPKRLISLSNRKSLFPDTMYSYNSGGDPNIIPSLTYEQFKNTHTNYYTPSNSCTYIYGDIDINKALKELDNYFSYFNKSQSYSIESKQKVDIVDKNFIGKYPSKDKDKLILSKNFAAGNIEDTKLQVSMEILMDILTRYNDSPLNKNTTKSNLYDELDYSIDSNISVPMYSIVANNIDRKDIDVLSEFIDNTLYKLSKTGFNEELINRAINNYSVQEQIKNNQIHKGIYIGYNLISSWGHNVDILTVLNKNEVIEDIKKVGNNDYFKELVRQHFVDNQYKSNVFLEPEITVASKKPEKTSSNVLDIKKENNLLYKWQQSKQKANIPILSRDEIDKNNIPKLLVNDNLNMYYISDTSNLIYLNLYLDTGYIPQQSLNEVFLYTELLNEALNSEEKVLKGNLKASHIVIPNYEDTNIYSPKTVISGVLDISDIDLAFNIINNLTLEDINDDLENKIKKIHNKYRESFNNNELETLELLSSKNMEGAGRYTYEMYIGFYKYLTSINNNYNNFENTIFKKLGIIDNTLYNSNTIRLGATLEKSHISKLEKSYEKYYKNLEKKANLKEKYVFNNENKNEGINIPSEVAYTVYSLDYKNGKGYYNGSLYVLSNILKSEYMIPNIRMKNGAYGAGVSFSPYGNFSFYTTQDAKFRSSLEIIKNSPDFIKSLDISKEELESYKIGALSQFERELGLNDSYNSIGNNLQKNYLSGLNYDILERVRNEILDTTLDDLKVQGTIIKESIKDGNYYIASNMSDLLQNKDLFDIIKEDYNE